MTSEVCAIANSQRRRRGLRGFAQAGAVASLFFAAAPASAVNGFTEDPTATPPVDLSNSNTAPTPVTFGVGDNFITGTTGSNTITGIDRDYFTFTLAPNQQLTAIMVLEGTTSLSGPNPDAPLSFIGLEAGSQLTNPGAPVVGELLGYTHYGPSLIGTDILDNIAAGPGAQGFSRPLGAGTYSVWIQEANTGTAHYAFNFVVGMVPEPSTWMMMLAGFGLMGFALRRQRDQIRSGPSSERSLAM